MVALSPGRSSVSSPFVRKCERTDNGLQNLTLLERRLPPKGRRFDIVHELPLPQYGSAVDTGCRARAMNVRNASTKRRYIA